MTLKTLILTIGGLIMLSGCAGHNMAKYKVGMSARSKKISNTMTAKSKSVFGQLPKFPTLNSKGAQAIFSIKPLVI